MTDRQLIARYQGGDEDAFTALYHRYKDRLYWFIRRYEKDSETARDLLQDVFLKLVRFANYYSPGGGATFKTWLYEMAKGVCYTHYQKHQWPRRKHTGVSKDGDYNLYLASDDPMPDEAAGLRMSIERMKRRLPLINEDHARAVILRDICGFEYSEIARTLNIPIGTVKSRINRGRNELAA